MRIVAPFRPFPLEAPHHIESAEAGFDWMDAIRMMSESAKHANQCNVHVLTDVDTDLPFPTLKYRTAERRLMLWYLEIAACYLESQDFDQDTVMLDSDQLIYGDLSRWFSAHVDLGICIRRPPKGAPGLPILNGVQFWGVRGKGRLGPFYRRALEIARALPERDIAWGADTEALRILLEPLEVGMAERDGLSVALIDSKDVIQALTGGQIEQLRLGRAVSHPHAPVLDFRNLRKKFMRQIYDATMRREVVA